MVFFFFFLVQNLYTFTLHFHIYKFLYYTMNKVLIDNIIIFYFSHYCYKFKKPKCQEEIKKKLLK